MPYYPTLGSSLCPVLPTHEPEGAMKRERLKRLLIGVVLLTLFPPGFFLQPPSTEAMLIPVDPGVGQGQPSLQRQDDLQKIQGVLEAKVIRQRLADLGFSA